MNAQNSVGNNPSRENSDTEQLTDANEAARGSRPNLLSAVVFWALCITLSAAGHRLYKEVVTLDRAASSDAYQSYGRPLVWVGYGDVVDSYERLAGPASAKGELGGLHVLPFSRFWLTTGIAFTALAAILAWSGRWITNTGFQSLVGLISGHLLWVGAIEIGLDVLGRRMGLAASLEVVEGRVVGTHAAGTLIQYSIVFLMPVLLAFTLHESNRCVVFQWLRKRLPLVPTPTPSGRVENYAARTCMQFFMTVWFCYVGVLWLADPMAGRLGEYGLLALMILITVFTPYMIWRTARQPNAGRALRYSVSGSVVAWTAIEIASSMQLLQEPWLNTSISSGLFFLTLTVILGALAVVSLSIRKKGLGLLGRPLTSASLLLVLATLIAGCSKSDQPAQMSMDELEQRLAEFDRRTQAAEKGDQEAMLQALVSPDPKTRAQAGVAFGKSRRISAVVKSQLDSMARNDESRLAQLAALDALQRLDLLTPELTNLRTKLFDAHEGPSIQN